MTGPMRSPASSLRLWLDHTFTRQRIFTRIRQLRRSGHHAGMSCVYSSATTGASEPSITAVLRHLSVRLLWKAH